MGWGIGKDAREKQLIGCHVPKRQIVTAGKQSATSTKKTAKEIIQSATACMTSNNGKAKSTKETLDLNTFSSTFPCTDHTAVVDAAAAFRRVAFNNCSALRAATAVLRAANISRPTSISVLFDLSAATAYPPQRAELHRQRYAGKELAYDDAVAIFAKLRCEKKDLPNYEITRPLLFRTDLNWNAMFMDKQLKRFVFKIFAVALKHAAVQMFAGKEIENVASVHVWSQTMEHTCIQNDSIHKGHSETSFATFGEGDLRCFSNAVQILLEKKPVVMHSIDTDFLLMIMCAAPWLPPIPTYMITLSDTVYDGNKIMARFAGKSDTDKINTAFWAMAFGTDYSNPLTNNGYFNKDLKELMFAEKHCRRPITILNETEACFDLKKALFVLKELKCSLGKKVPKDSLKTTLLKMLFCLQYYGLMFVDAAGTLFPNTPVLDPKLQTCTFQYRPSITAILNTDQ